MITLVDSHLLNGLLTDFLKVSDLIVGFDSIESRVNPTDKFAFRKTKAIKINLRIKGRYLI